MDILIFVSVFLPMASAPAVFALGEKARHALAVAVASVELVCCVALLSGCTAEIPYFCGLGARFASGGFGSVLSVLCALVFLLSILASRSYFAGEPRVGRYYAFPTADPQPCREFSSLPIFSRHISSSR